MGKISEANRYFTDRIQKAYINRVMHPGLEPLNRYLKSRDWDKRYRYTLYVLLSLNKNDLIFEGTRRKAPNSTSVYEKYYWVEFSFKGEIYVFDFLIRRVLPKDEWYTKYLGEFFYKSTQEQVLEFCLNNDENAVLLHHDDKSGELWQFNRYDDGKSELGKALSLARIQILKKDNQPDSIWTYTSGLDQNEWVKSFIAFDPDSN